MSPVIITTTTNNEENALEISNALVKRKLAACVNIIGPVKSVYHWQGDLVQDVEYKLFIKSFQSLWDKIRQAIIELHPYSVAEISMIPVEKINPAYLDWMKENISE